MYVKKNKGKIYGASFSEAEQKAINAEIRKMEIESDRKHAVYLDSLILWQLHEQLGFGKDRLHRFFKEFNKLVDELHEFYEMDGEDELFVYQQLLLDKGIDVEAWEKELEKGGAE